MSHDTANHKTTMKFIETGVGRDRIQTLKDMNGNVKFVRCGYGSWEKKEK